MNKIQEKSCLNKTNLAIDIANNLNLLSLKAFDLIGFYLEKQNYESNVVRIPIKAGQKMLCGDNRHSHQRLKSTFLSLQKSLIYIVSKKFTGSDTLNYIYRVTIEDNCIVVKLPDEVVNLLKRGTIDENGDTKIVPYTKFLMQILSRVRCKYAYKFYQVLKRLVDQSNGKLNFSMNIKYLRQILGCVSIYQNFSEFNRRVLQTAIKEINDKTDIKILGMEKDEKTPTNIVFRLDRQNLKEVIASQIEVPKQAINSQEQIIISNPQNIVLEPVKEQIIEIKQEIVQAVATLVPPAKKTAEIVVPEEVQEVMGWGYKGGLSRLLWYWNNEDLARKREFHVCKKQTLNAYDAACFKGKGHEFNKAAYFAQRLNSGENYCVTEDLTIDKNTPLSVEEKQKKQDIVEKQIEAGLLEKKRQELRMQVLEENHVKLLAENKKIGNFWDIFCSNSNKTVNNWYNLKEIWVDCIRLVLTNQVLEMCYPNSQKKDFFKKNFQDILEKTIKQEGFDLEVVHKLIDYSQVDISQAKLKEPRDPTEEEVEGIRKLIAGSSSSFLKANYA